MTHPARVLKATDSGPPLGLYNPSVSDVFLGGWKINGYRATLIVWTVEEWDTLLIRPNDAQFFPCGIWCALRME